MNEDTGGPVNVGLLKPIGPNWDLAGRFVRLRPLRESDLPARLAMTNDPLVQKETLGMTVGERTPYDIRSWFRTLSQDASSRQVAIEDAAGRYIGDVDVHSVTPDGEEGWIETMVGDRGLRGQGEAVFVAHLEDALGALVGYLFDRIGLRRVRAECLSTHPALLRALESLGFEEDGQIDHMNGVVSHIMQLTPERFRKRAPAGEPAKPGEPAPRNEPAPPGT